MSTAASSTPARHGRSGTEISNQLGLPSIWIPDTRAKQQEALRAKYDYQAFSFAHAKRTFDFQYRSGRVIFWVVLQIVFAGLAFSAVQFYVGIRHPLESRAKGVQGIRAGRRWRRRIRGNTARDQTEVVGLGMADPCVMSMVFYLDLKNVYLISNISQ